MEINKIVFSITFKILMGFVLSSAMIIFLWKLSEDLHLFLGQFEHGDLLQMGSFGLLLMAATAGLFFMFMKKQAKTDSRQAVVAVASLLSFDFKVLGISFLEGFLGGLAKESRKSNIADK